MNGAERTDLGEWGFNMACDLRRQVDDLWRLNKGLESRVKDLERILNAHLSTPYGSAPRFTWCDSGGVS